MADCPIPSPVTYLPFGAATTNKSTSEASRRGEGDFWTVFGTAILPTGTSGASSRGERELLTGLRHGSPVHRYLSGILAWRRCLTQD